MARPPAPVAAPLTWTFVPFTCDFLTKSALLRLGDGNVVESIVVPLTVVTSGTDPRTLVPVYNVLHQVLLRIKTCPNNHSEVPLASTPDGTRAMHPVSFSSEGNPVVQVLQLADGNSLELRTTVHELRLHGRDPRSGLPLYAARYTTEVKISIRSRDPLGLPGSTVVKEIVREIVRIPCRYCGTLNENTAVKCVSCGASTR